MKVEIDRERVETDLPISELAGCYIHTSTINLYIHMYTLYVLVHTNVQITRMVVAWAPCDAMMRPNTGVPTQMPCRGSKR